MYEDETPFGFFPKGVDNDKISVSKKENEQQIDTRRFSFLETDMEIA